MATVENPSGSYIWDVPAFKAVSRKCVRVDFDACMHGADRDKRTTLLCSDNTFVYMRKKCDKSHAHKAWGVDPNSETIFKTAEECEYPAQMCRTMAALAAAKAGTMRRQTLTIPARPEKVQSVSLPLDEHKLESNPSASSARKPFRSASLQCGCHWQRQSAPKRLTLSNSQAQ